MLNHRVTYVLLVVLYLQTFHRLSEFRYLGRKAYPAFGAVPPDRTAQATNIEQVQRTGLVWTLVSRGGAHPN